VLRCTVAFVSGEAIARIETIHLCHKSVPGDLGHDGGAGDGKALAVPSFEALLREGQGGESDAVDEEEGWKRGKLTYRFDHSLASCGHDPLGIDNLDRGCSDAYSDGLLLNQVGKGFSPLRGKLLTVPHQGEPGRAKGGREDHRCRHNRPCQRTTPHLVDAGNEPVTVAPKLLLLSEVRHRGHFSASSAFWPGGQ
jgi:hypothetical protein